MKARERRQKSPFLSNWVLDRIKKHKKKETNRSHYLAQMHGLHDMRTSSYLDTIKGRGWANNTSLPRRPLRIEVRRRTIWEWGPRRRRGASIGLSHPSWSFSADSPPPGARSGFIPGYGESPMTIILVLVLSTLFLSLTKVIDWRGNSAISEARGHLVLNGAR